MEPIGDLLRHRANQMDLGRQNELALIQLELDRLLPNKGARATKIDRLQRKLVVTVPTSSVATLVRYGQPKLLVSIKDITQPSIEKISLRVI